MDEMDAEITVLGAGVAGLTVALALAQRGMSVTVMERAPEITEVGAGFQISPNGVRVLRALGLAEALAAVSPRSKAVELRDGFSGRVALRMTLPETPGFYLVHRADLVDILAQAVRDAGVKIQLLQHVKSVEIDASGAPLLRMMTGNTHRPAVLIGADGLNAPSRRAVLQSDVKPFFTGQVAWRALVPANPGSAPEEARVYMGPGRHLVSYPLRDGGLRNLVAVEERTVWAEEGWTHRDDPARLRRAFSNFAPEVRGWLAEAREVHLWGLFRHPVPERWHRGNAVLLGDAVHPTLPFMAQGANMALEDAWVLAEAMDQAASPKEAFVRYQAARIDRVKRIVEAANKNARAYHLQGPARLIAQTGLRAINAVAPQKMLGRFDWIYDYDATSAA